MSFSLLDPDFGGTMTIIGKDGASQTHRDMRRHADRVAQALALEGVEAGTRVGILVPVSLDVPLLCTALWRVGATIVPLPSRATMETREAWRARLDKVVGHTELSMIIDTGIDMALPVKTLSAQRLIENDRAAPDLPSPSPAQAALIQRTSGTTGDPKALVISYATLATRARWLRDNSTPDDSYLSWTPPETASGFHYLVTRWVTGGLTGAIMEASTFRRDPGAWLRAISQQGTTHAVGTTYTFGLVAQALESGRVVNIDLSRWREALVGGESIDAATLRRFAIAAEPYGFDPYAFRPAYGMSEVAGTRGVCCCPPGRGIHEDIVDRESLALGHALPARDEAGDDAARFVALGPPEQGTGLRIVDDGDDDLGERRIGEIWVRSPFMIDRYLDPATTEEAFVDRWLRTGDLGYQADGELYITGRSKDVIIVKGRTLFAEDIERIANAAPGVRTSAAVAVRDRATESVLLYCETNSATETTRRDVVRRIWSSFGVSPRVELIEPGRLPRNDFGKVLRRYLPLS